MRIRKKKIVETLTDLVMPIGDRYIPNEMDIFLLSYPKSGNTWTRFLVANILSNKVDFENIEEIVPDLYVNYKRDIKKSGFNVYKSHASFTPKYRKVIYIVRDPRDVLVSYYYHCLKFGYISDSCSLSEFIPIFKDGRIDGYGSWYENVSSWISSRDIDSNFLLIKYEDLIANTKKEVKKICEFMNIFVSDEKVDRIVQNSSFEKMKNLETLSNNKWKPLKHSKSNNIPFIRSGSTNQWENIREEKAFKSMVEDWRCIMEKLNYI